MVGGTKKSKVIQLIFTNNNHIILIVAGTWHGNSRTTLFILVEQWFKIRKSSHCLWWYVFYDLYFRTRSYCGYALVKLWCMRFFVQLSFLFQITVDPGSHVKTLMSQLDT